MECGIRIIKNPTSIVSITKYKYKNKECLAISKGKVVEIRNLDMSLISTFYPNDYIHAVVSLNWKRGTVLLICGKGKYRILHDDEIVFSGLIPGGKIIKKVLVVGKGMILIDEYNNVIMAELTIKGVLFDNSLSDLDFYSILDSFTTENDIYFLVKEISEEVFLLKYTPVLNKPKLLLKEKIGIRKGITSVGFLDKGMYLVGNKKIYFNIQEKCVFESEFANNAIVSRENVEGGVIFLMKDGEIIRLTLNKTESIVADANKDVQPEIILLQKNNEDNSEVKKSTEQVVISYNLNFEVLKKLKNSFSGFLKLENGTFLCSSDVSDSYLIKITKETFKETHKEVEIIKKYENSSPPFNLIYEGDKFRFLGRNGIKTITFKTDLIEEQKNIYEKTIRFFDIYEDIRFVSFLDESKIYKNNELVKLEIGEIINSYSFDFISLNTKECVYSFISNQIVSSEHPGILISSYSKDYCVIFDEFRKLMVLNRRDLTKTAELVCNYEPSMIFVETYIALITYHNQLIIYDFDLKILKIMKCETMKTYCFYKNSLFLSDLGEHVYEADLSDIFTLNKNEVNLKLICKADTPIEKLIVTEDYLMIKGFKSIFMNLKNYNCYRCSVKNISHALYANNKLFYSVGPKMYTSNFKIDPKLRVQKAEKAVEGILGFLTSRNEEDFIGSYEMEYHIDKSPTATSYLNLITPYNKYRTLLQDEVIRDGKYLSDGTVVVVSNITYGNKEIAAPPGFIDLEVEYSKISLFSTKKGKISLIYKNIYKGCVYALEVSKDFIVTHNGCNLCIYKKQKKVLVRLASIKVPFIVPFKIAVNENLIACSSLRSSFGIYNFNPENNSLSCVFLCRKKIQVENLIFADKKLLVTTVDGKILLFDEMFSYTELQYNERIVDIKEGSLMMPKSNNVKKVFYFITKDCSVGIITILDNTKIDIGILRNLEILGNKVTLFNKESMSESFIDIDLINFIEKDRLENYVKETGYNKSLLITLLNDMNEAY